MENLSCVLDDAACAPGGRGTGAAVLREIARLLGSLVLNPQLSGVIDLRSLPLQADELALLRQRLGDGQIEATLDLDGPTRISETAYSGVWWVRHMSAERQVVFEQVIVARVPELLLAHPADMDAAARRLAVELGDAQLETHHAGIDAAR